MQNIIVHRYGPNEGTLVPVSEEGARRLGEMPEYANFEHREGRYYLDGVHVADIRQDYQGYLEPEDRSWIAFIRADGVPIFYLNRDPATGAILDSAEAGAGEPAPAQG